MRVLDTNAKNIIAGCFEVSVDTRTGGTPWLGIRVQAVDAVVSGTSATNLRQLELRVSQDRVPSVRVLIDNVWTQI